jgi:hypothetical protein
MEDCKTQGGPQSILEVLESLATPLGMEYKQAAQLFIDEGFKNMADLLEDGKLWHKLRVPKEYPDYHVPARLMQKLINYVAGLSSR